MRNLEYYGNVCIDELYQMGVHVENLPDLEWSVSKRAKRRYGQCKYKNGNRVEINISQFLLDENITPEDSLKNTIIHELLHAMTKGEGHKGKWKTMADYVSRASNGRYIIQRCTSYEDKGIDANDLCISRRELEPKYVICCNNCGGQIIRRKKTKVIRRPDLYRCGRCRGKLTVKALSV